MSLRWPPVRQDLVPRAIGAVATVTFPYRLPGPELIPQEIPPEDARAIAVDDAIDHPSAVDEGASPAGITRREERRDPVPLLISQGVETRSRCRHTDVSPIPTYPVKRHALA